MGKTQYVAFLRAINVGKRIVKMPELKKIFEGLGLEDVETFIASGNVMFTSSKPAASLTIRIESGLEEALGFPVVTMLRTTSDVKRISTYEAFPPEVMKNAASFYVGLMRDKPTPAAIRKALALQTTSDELNIARGEVYWVARKTTMSASTINYAVVEKMLQTPVTFRNINTLRRLAAKYPV